MKSLQTRAQISGVTEKLRAKRLKEMERKFNFKQCSGPKEIIVSCKPSTLTIKKLFSRVFNKRKILSWESDDIIEYLTVYVDEGANLNISKFVKKCLKKSSLLINGSTILRFSLKQWDQIFLVDEKDGMADTSSEEIPSIRERISISSFVDNQCQMLKLLLEH